MTVSPIIEELEKLDKETIQIQTRKLELLKQIKEADKEEWDWIPVRKGAEMLDITQPTIYARINAGKLSARHIGSKVYVKKSELMAINDTYSVQTLACASVK